MGNLTDLPAAFGYDPLAHLPADYEPNVDLFAGGGGASTGMEMALGKSPDLAINHDPEALAMHEANHPDTVHLCQNIVQVHPLQATGGRMVGALWASPDCTHFSKAKGGKPRDQFIRDLAWTVIRWAQHCRPLLINMENVEEFQTWGPLDVEGQPIKARAGETFRQWVRALRNLGYSVSWRELVACDYGAPTTRKRLFVTARLDGKRAKWPRPTHGPGLAQPWRTAAECIDWTDPAPSIFERKKPLAENTQRRIAEGIRRYVLNAARPFLVAYYGPKRPGEFRGSSIDDPLPTQTTENRFGLVSPYLVKPNHTAAYYRCFRGQGIDEPLGSITQSPGFALAGACLVTNTSGHAPGDIREPAPTITTGNQQALVTANLITIDQQGGEGEFCAASREVSAPLNTITAKNRHALVSACLVGAGGPKYAGKPVAVDKPLGTILMENHRNLSTAHLIKMRGTNIGRPVDEPLHTISAQGTHHGLISASLIKYYSEGGQHAGLDEPLHTATTRARMGLQAVHLQQYNGCSEAQPVDGPLPAVTTRDRFGLTAATLCQYNSASECQPLDEPAPTLLGQNKFGLVECPLESNPGHYEEVRAFLRHWGVIGPEDEAEVVIDGVVWRINDIGLRMLRPRELFLCNGFRPSYVIAPIYKGKPLTITSQVAKCGNSVPPQFAEAVLRANLDALDFVRAAAWQRPDFPMFAPSAWVVSPGMSSVSAL